MMLKYFILLLIVSVVISAAKKSYEGYKVYKVTPKTSNDIDVLTDMQNKHEIGVWEEGFGLNFGAKVMVSKENKDSFLKKCNENGIEAVEVIVDLQKLIDDQLKPSPKTRSTENESFLNMKWDTYYNLSVTYNWLDEVADAYPEVVQKVVMGTSYEGREIKGIIIDYNPGKVENKLIGMIEGTLHAREWIAPVTVTWIIKEFLTSTDPEVRRLAESFEWHIFPITNPDGYEFTFTHNRMWRKNRNPEYNTTCTGESIDMSLGVDLNRNFNYQWMVIGASNDPCSNTYAGPSAFSEPESRAIAQYAINLRERGNFIHYIAFHSYSQLVIIPYSHVNDSSAVIGDINYGDMFEVAARGADRLKNRYGTEYRVGVSLDTLRYPMSGTSFDWVKEQINVPFSYLIELRDTQEYGFLLPAEQIIPNCEEVMDFLVEMDDTARRLHYYSRSSHILVSYTVILFAVILTKFVI